jgi:hypothetical protein
MTDGVTGRCAAHGVAAIAECARCGDYLCGDCRVWNNERPHCAACRDRLGNRPSTRARLSLLLVTFGVCGGVPAIIGFVLARRELRAIRAGEAPSAGEGMAETARNLGVFYTVVIALAVISRLLR